MIAVVFARRSACKSLRNNFVTTPNPFVMSPRNPNFEEPSDGKSAEGPQRQGSDTRKDKATWKRFTGSLEVLGLHKNSQEPQKPVGGKSVGKL